MKDFIVMMGILPILIAFIMQFAVDYRNYEEVQTIQSVVYTAKETAKQEGGFSNELQAKIKSDIASRLSINQENVDIVVEEKAGEVGRFDDDRNIHYRVEVKIDEIMAAGKLFGISKKDNCRIYVIDSYTASEYVGCY